MPTARNGGPIGHAGGVSDQPTTPLPLPEVATPPPAWDDAPTRRSVNRSLRVALLSIVVALAATAGCGALVLLGQLGEPWGLWVLVLMGGVAGGALAGGVTMLTLWARTRSFLRGGPWVPALLTLGDDHDAELAVGRWIGQVRLEPRAGSLGDPDEEIAVDVRSDGGRVLITVPPSRHIVPARSAPEAS